MHIAFKFKYIHSNGLFTRLSQRIGESSFLDINAYNDKDMFYIESSGTQAELEELATLVSSIVPQSLFLHQSTLEEINTLSEVSQSNTEVSSYEIPYCIECQNEIIETLNPFNECNVCGFSDIEVKSKNFGCLDFNLLADSLIENKELVLETFNGIRRFALLSTSEQEEAALLICDPSHISEHFLLTQGELEALMMVEKPSVRLKPKKLFLLENELQKPIYPVFFADDKITLALTTTLAKKGVVAIYCDKEPSLRVATALGENIIVNVGRDVLPWEHKFKSNVPLCSSFAGYNAYVDTKGLVLSDTQRQRSEKAVEFVSANSFNKKENTISFMPAHGALRSVVLEQGLDNKSLCMLYLSREYDSHICSYSPKIGYTSMVNFIDESLSSPKAMLEAIASMDEAGQRLIDNFKNTYPKLYETLLDTQMDSNENSSTLTKLWAMAAHFIGITNEQNYKVASEYLEVTALEFQGKSGPRIDYKVLKEDDGYQLDPRLAIRSAISFKLAGVDEYLLSFGFIDSLADFLAEQAEFSDGNIGIDGVVIAGSLFENHQLLMRAYNALSPNYQVYRNKRLSIDGANVAAGAVTLGNE